MSYYVAEPLNEWHLFGDEIDAKMAHEEFEESFCNENLLRSGYEYELIPVVVPRFDETIGWMVEVTQGRESVGGLGEL